ncbi:hypothetical protein [Eisenibacter elegans]|jgi:outer membrane biosynthesis protein TonB|uniref:hypothetical protein n=1 Tax=Eisenibacter elegans TaxID=997 RepID=UPI000421F66A|nr:hypothetical protein [Eisenibacter elegans]
MEEENKLSKQMSAFVMALVIHLGLLLLLLMWRIQYPVNQSNNELGMEVAYGLDNTGSDIQAIPVEAIPVAAEAFDPPQEPVEEEPVFSQQPTDISTEKKQPKEPVKQQQQQKTTPDKTQQKQQQTTTSTQTDGRNPSTYQKGDDQNKEGDKGKQTGSPDKNASYQAYGGTGTTLTLTGWNWEKPPQVQDRSNEAGRLVFQILVDDRGEVIGVTTLESTLSATVEKLYERELYRTRFYPIEANTNPAPVSKGVVTFVIRNR